MSTSGRQYRLEIGRDLGPEWTGRSVIAAGGVEDPAGVEGFRLGGWFFETDRGEDGEKFTLDKALDTAALLLGRRSYEFFAATWPRQPPSGAR